MTPAKLQLTQAAIGNLENRVGKLCHEIGGSSQTLYRHVATDGLKLLGQATP
jgi:hypothetical protein